MKWEPKNGDEYWMVLELLPGKVFICSAVRGKYGSSETEIKKGNVFKTKHQAQKHLNELGLKDCS